MHAINANNINELNFKPTDTNYIDLFEKYGIENDCCRSALIRMRTIEPLAFAHTFPKAKPSDTR